MKADDLINFFQRAIHPLKVTVQLLTGKAVIKLVDDSKDIQEVQLKALAEETLSRIPRVQNFGFSSNPPTDSEAIIVSLGGLRENVVVITADNRAVRVKNIAPGESVVYTDDGTKIHLKKGGLVDVVAATKVLVTCPDVEFTGNVKVNGNLHVVGTVQGDQTGNFTVGVGAGYYSGPLGGAPMPMVTSVPIESTATITSTAVVTGSNVVGGGTDLATVKGTFNTHKHNETNGAGGTSAPTTTV